MAFNGCHWHPVYHISWNILLLSPLLPPPCPLPPLSFAATATTTCLLPRQTASWTARTPSAAPNRPARTPNSASAAPPRWTSSSGSSLRDRPPPSSKRCGSSSRRTRSSTSRASSTKGEVARCLLSLSLCLSLFRSPKDKCVYYVSVETTFLPRASNQSERSALC